MPVGDGDILRGVLNMTMANGDDAKNVFSFEVEKVSLGDWLDAAASDYVRQAIGLVMTELLADITTDCTFDTIDVYRWTGTLWDYIGTTLGYLTALDIGEPLPAGVAMLMTAYTLRNKVFGRKFVYGTCEDNLTDGFLNAATLANLADAALEYITAYSGGTMGPLDFLHPGVYSSAALGFERFGNVAVVKDVLSYQRRRKTGVGV